VYLLGVFLVAKEVGFRANARAREPPNPWRLQEACLLMSRPMHDPITEVVSRAMPPHGILEPLSPDGSRLVFLCPGLGWRRKPGRSQGPSLGVSSIGSLKHGQAPKPCVGAAPCLGSAWFLGRRVRASVPEGYSPRASGDPRGVGRGVPLAENY
jgi:hypothetical protein